MADLTAQPLGPSGGFNWVFLVDLLVCGVLALFFLFYFNRLFATIVAYAIRVYTWHKFRAYIDISALQISLLGGRLFFKSIRYHAHNVTVLVHDGHVTWRYWLRTVQEAEIFRELDEKARRASAATSASGNGGESDSNDTVDEKPRARSESVGKEETGGKQKKELPCRISVKVSGVEAFLYNRSPVYDAIVEAAKRKSEEGKKNSSSDHAGPPASSGSETSDSKEKAAQRNDLEHSATVDTNASQTPYTSPGIPSFLHMLPVRIDCKRAAAAVGNENTTSVITAKLEQAGGTFDAGSAGHLDLFKILMNFEFKKVNVAMRPNRDFKQLQLDTARRVLHDRELSQGLVEQRSLNPFRPIRRWWHGFKSVFSRRNSSHGSIRTASMKSEIVDPGKAAPQDPIPGQAQWHGLMRYLDEHDISSTDEWQEVEYAKSSTLVDCDQIDMRFYWDIPGQVPNAASETETLLSEEERDHMNGSKPPDYGLDLAVHGGFIVYGPWADRQRVNIQNFFVPPTYVDAHAADPLRAGDTRVSTIFKIFVSVEKDVTLRIPSRESSKDSKWQGRAGGNRHGNNEGSQEGKGKPGKKQKHGKRRKGKQTNPADARPYAWLDIVVKADSTVNYIMDMFPRKTGFRNSVDLDIKGTEIKTSVNHGLFWRAGPLTMEADLSYALGWNTLRSWPFKLVCDDIELFIIRDHMFLITDLINDWSSGPPPPFYTFIPFKYNLDVSFRNWVMYLNTNDGNIINEPADFDKNEFLSLGGQDLHALLDIPLENFRPKRNDISFDVLSQGMFMDLLSSPRSTTKELLTDKRVADLPQLTLKGSFSGNSESAPGLVDVLRMDLVGTGLTLKAYGFLMRHFINVKENYFGDYVHFKTLEEFQDSGDNIKEANEQTVSLPKPQTANEMDVILCITADQASLLLPTNLYSAKEYVRADLQHAAIDLRIASYYMDLAINFSPISFLLGASHDEEGSPVESASNTQLYIHHVDLDGHRAFGLPPNEPAYAASWYIDVGAITGECKSSFIHDLALAAKSFAFTFPDSENALPIETPNIFYDVTFMQLKTDIVKIWLHAGKDALLVSTDPVSVDFNDWADKTFSQRVSVLVPNLTVACVDRQSATRHLARQKRRQAVRTHAFLQTSVALNVVGRKAQFSEELMKQQAYLRNQDQRTRRIPFLQRDIPRPRRNSFENVNPQDVEPPYMPYPSYPAPLNASGQERSRPASIKSVPSFVNDRILKGKASSSSLSSSIRSGGLAVPPLARGRSTGLSSTSSRSRSSQSSDGLSLERRAVPGGGGGHVVADFAPSSMAFSSPFAEPYFPLDLIEPDQTNVPAFAEAAIDGMDGADDSDTEPEIHEDPDLDDDSSHTTIMLNLVPGLRAYIEPRVATVAAKMLRTLQPNKPEDVMDDFQINVMGTIEGQQQENIGKGFVLEVKANLPAARLRVCAPREDDRPSDTVDINMDRLAFLMRQRQAPRAKNRQQNLAFHIMLASMGVSLHEGVALVPGAAALSLTVEDLTMWIALGAAQTGHISLRDAALLVASKQAEYMTGLAQRLAPIIQDMQERFGKPLEASERRLRLLVHTLTQHGEHIGDPPFMSRMTYLLRAFHAHYRNQESWKILMRFRHTLQCMPKDNQASLEQQMKSDDIACPDDAPDQALQSWSQWKNWDVPHIGRTVAFQILFGGESDKPLQAPKAKPIALTWDTESLKVAIDEGKHASHVAIDDVSVAVKVTPPSTPTGLMLVDENKRTKTQVQLHSANTAFRFHWSLVDLVEVVVPRVQKVAGEIQPQQEHRSPGQAPEDGLNRHDFHVVVSTDQGSIELQTINLKHMSQAEGLRMSLIGTTQANDRYGECVCVLINADSAITELYGQSACIWQTLLTSPSVYVDQLSPAPGVDTPPTVTLAVSYGMLQVDVKEQLPGILHIVDHIIVDEVARVQKLVELIKDNMPDPQPKQSTPSNDTATSSPVKFHAALLAGQLLLNISLLQSLSYRLDGTAASVRVAPSLTKEHKLGIDFDVGKQNHSFINHSEKVDHQQGLLEVPPINGHVGLQLDPEKTAVSVATTINQVEVDAGAIQGIATVLSKTEVQDVLSAIQSGVEDIQGHVMEIFPKKPKDNTMVKAAAQKLVVYHVQFALLGVRISATTPHMAVQSTAQLEVGIGPLHAVASNKANIDSGDPSLFPEMTLKVRDVGANLTIIEKSRKQHVGNVTLAVMVNLELQKDNNGRAFRELTVRTPNVDVNAYPETAALIVDVINHMQDRIKDLDLSREVDYLRRLRANRKTNVVKQISGKESKGPEEGQAFSATDLLSMRVTLELAAIQVSWIVDSRFSAGPKSEAQDLVLSLARIEFNTRGSNEARLTIQDLQLQMVPKSANKISRSLNSALLPEVGFSVAYWSKNKERSLAFKATGKPLDLCLESRFMLPVHGVQKSVEYAIERFRTGTANWQSIPTSSGAPRKQILGKNHFASLLVEADFAGVDVYLRGSGPPEPTLSTVAAVTQEKAQRARYGSNAGEENFLHTSLKAPGIALKLEYNDTEARPVVNGELRVDASTNMLLPNVVPLVLEVSNTIKEVMQSEEPSTPATPRPRADAKSSQRFFEDETIVKADPTAIFGKTKVNLGLRICRQEFGLTCQPIAKVDAKAELDDFYFTVNTIDSEEQGHFFAMSAVLTKLSTKVKHVYSREPTFSFEMDSIILSLMNSKHFSGVNGMSAIIKINPTRTSINGKQLQDLLLFQEIWLPPEIRDAGSQTPAPPQESQGDDYMVQRYQSVAAAAAFPWSATVSIAELAIDLDLGQSIGKSSFSINNLWASSQKASNWEQNLCIGMDDMAMNSQGRMSGFIKLSKLGVRTSIRWPQDAEVVRKTPLIQASVGFQKLRAKAAFDYQAFAFGDIEGFDFLMYNVRHPRGEGKDRLVAVLDCSKAYVFCTSTSPAQAFGLYQAFHRLIQDKQAAFEQQLKDMEKQLRRDSSAAKVPTRPQAPRAQSKITRAENRSPISLHTDVVVTIGAISVGAFPGTFFDSQILKLEATNIQARFAVGLERGKIHSGLGMTLGQLQVALATTKRVAVPKTLGDITVDEVTNSAVNAKGGTILRVPKVVASMQTWHAPETNTIEYIFKSLFEGKVDVGWNLSRINFIQGMYTTHTRALASRLGKALPESAVKITAGPQTDPSSQPADKATPEPPAELEQQKITAEVNLPQFKYEYKPLEEPIIETPQLRDMGEATPPLEWIGLHRDKLPNVTHQIVIVSLLEVAKEVEDAYERILGSS